MALGSLHTWVHWFMTFSLELLSTNKELIFSPVSYFVAENVIVPIILLLLIFSISRIPTNV